MLRALSAKIAGAYDQCYDRYLKPTFVHTLWEKLDRAGHHSVSLSRTDWIISAVFAGLALLLTLRGFHLAELGAKLFGSSTFMQADIGRVLDNMTSTRGEHSRTAVHPLSSILLTPIGLLLQLFGLSTHDAAKSMTVAIMTLNGGFFFLTLRVWGLPRLVASLFSALFLCSAAFMFWGSVVELYPFALFTIIAALFMMAYPRVLAHKWWIIMNILTLSITITNYVFGLIATAAKTSLKQFIIIVTSAMAISASLAVVQNFTFEEASLFFNPIPLMRETAFTQPSMQAREVYEHGWQPLDNIRSLYVTTVVAMPPEVQAQGGRHQLVTTNQNTGFPEGDITPIIATTAWVILLGLGVWGAVANKALRTPATGLGLMLLAQTVLHVVYGEITFLYSLHFLPVLIIVAALSWFSKYRWLAAGLAVIVLIFGSVNNVRQLQATHDMAACLTRLPVVQAHQTWERMKTVKRPDHVLDEQGRKELNENIAKCSPVPTL